MTLDKFNQSYIKLNNLWESGGIGRRVSERSERTINDSYELNESISTTHEINFRLLEWRKSSQYDSLTGQ